MLNATYGAVRNYNQGIAPDYVRYAGEAVQIADRTGDAALTDKDGSCRFVDVQANRRSLSLRGWRCAYDSSFAR
jgi:hypothetical protein